MSQVSLGKVKGDNGADGKSPYQVAVEEGYNGTEAEFYAALVSLQNAPFLPASGGEISGNLLLRDCSLQFSDAQNENSVVLFGAYNSGTPAVSFSGSENDERVLLSGVASPRENSDAANKQYVDNLVGDINGVLDTINGEVV